MASRGAWTLARGSWTCLLLLLVHWVCTLSRVSGSEDGAFSLKSMIDEQSFKYPKEVLRLCGDSKGRVPVLDEKLEEFDKCYQKEANVAKMMEEFMIAIEEETMQNATKYHCHKVAPVYKCIRDLVSGVEHCFEPKQRDDLWMLAQVVKSVMDFVCYEDGTHVSIFLKDGGLECVMDFQDELQECTVWNDTYDVNLTATDDGEFMRRFSFDEGSCRKLLGIADCLFEKLKQCPDRTPSLLMKALTKDVFKETPCWTYVSSAFSIFSYRYLTFLSIALGLLFSL